MLPHDQRGAGDAVLLLHAGIADRTMWSEHLDWLADAGFWAIAVDLPGFGEARIEPGPQAPWQDVLSTLKELEVPTVSLVGNSFGAAVALRAAVIAPSAVRSLVLISPPPLQLDPSPRLAAAWEAEEEALERGDLDAAVEAVVGAWLQPAAPDELRRRVGAMQRRAFENQRSAPQVEDAPDPLDQRPEGLASLSMPVLTAAGESDLPDFRTGAEEIAGLVPDGRMVTFDDSGHLAPLEVPDAFQAVLEEFLQTGPHEPDTHTAGRNNVRSSSQETTKP
jgi:pimeloyl-ACP methyl ester carboxylesterase